MTIAPTPAPPVAAQRRRTAASTPVGTLARDSASRPAPLRGARILIFSPAFAPAVGGLETATALLANEIQRLGCDVVVVTQTPARGPETVAFPVVRNPSSLELLRWARWCDLYYQANVSLRGLWPLAWVRRPWVVSHHGWYRRPGGSLNWRDRLKRRLVARAAASIAVSAAIGADLGSPCLVIPNGYDDRLFRVMPEVKRTIDLVCVARLVSEKGVDLLIEALVRLGVDGSRPRLTIVGGGPEAPRLRQQILATNLQRQVEMLGVRTGEELVRILNRHRILVVPSRFDEPFGIVALEGIACGCVVVGSWGGGLAGAIGPCGKTFPNGNAKELARVLATLLAEPSCLAPYRQHAHRHLAAHSGERNARLYLAAFARALERGSRPRRSPTPAPGAWPIHNPPTMHP